MFGETHTGREELRKGKRDLNSYTSAHHTTCGTVKPAELNTTVYNEPNVDNNIIFYHYDSHEKAKRVIKVTAQQQHTQRLLTPTV